jgi:hypothetical protein
VPGAQPRPCRLLHVARRRTTRWPREPARSVR